MLCASCSTDNPHRARFCLACGKPFAATADTLTRHDTLGTQRLRSSDALGDSLLGSCLRGYRIEARLGKGGMGVVFRAEQIALGRTVALKVLALERASEGEFIERFQREAQAVAALEHPHIVAVHDMFSSDGLFCIAMAFAPGGSLKELLGREGPLPEARAASLILDAALGLQAAFEQGIVHRDIKPDNLLLGNDGRVRVGDFGLARAAENALELTQSGAVLGTPAFMAPEQWEDLRQADHRSDLYSLGCALFQLLSGSTPFTGPSAPNYLKQHTSQLAPRLKELGVQVSSAMENVVRRLLAKDPQERYQTGAELAKDLEPLARVGETTRAVAGHKPEPSRPPKQMRGSWLLVLLLAGLLVAGITLPRLGLWLAPPDSGPGPPDPAGRLREALAHAAARADSLELAWQAEREQRIQTAGLELTAARARADEALKQLAAVQTSWEQPLAAQRERSRMLREQLTAASVETTRIALRHRLRRALAEEQLGEAATLLITRRLRAARSQLSGEQARAQALADEGALLGAVQAYGAVQQACESLWVELAAAEAGLGPQRRAHLSRIELERACLEADLRALPRADSARVWLDGADACWSEGAFEDARRGHVRAESLHLLLHDTLRALLRAGSTHTALAQQLDARDSTLRGLLAAVEDALHAQRRRADSLLQVGAVEQALAVMDSLTVGQKSLLEQLDRLASLRTELDEALPVWEALAGGARKRGIADDSSGLWLGEVEAGLQRARREQDPVAGLQQLQALQRLWDTGLQHSVEKYRAAFWEDRSLLEALASFTPECAPLLAQQAPPDPAAAVSLETWSAWRQACAHNTQLLDTLDSGLNLTATDFARARMLRSAQRVKAGAYPEALADLEQVLQLLPAGRDFLGVSAADLQGDVAHRQAQIYALLARDREVVQTCTRALELQQLSAPIRVQLLLERGRAAARTDALEAAVADFVLALRACDDSQRISLWLECARLRQQSGDLVGARKDLDEALRLDSEDLAVRRQRLAVLEALRDWPAAETELSQLLATAASAPLYEQRAWLRAWQGQVRGAQADLERAQALEPQARRVALQAVLSWADADSLATRQLPEALPDAGWCWLELCAPGQFGTPQPGSPAACVLGFLQGSLDRETAQQWLLAREQAACHQAWYAASGRASELAGAREDARTQYQSATEIPEPSPERLFAVLGAYRVRED